MTTKKSIMLYEILENETPEEGDWVIFDSRKIGILDKISYSFPHMFWVRFEKQDVGWLFNKNHFINSEYIKKIRFKNVVSL